MSDQDSRIIPPGQFGSPFAEASGSMHGPELDLALQPHVFDFGRRGGTDMAAAMAAIAAHIPRDKRYDGCQLVITDGPPPGLEDDEAAAARLKALIARSHPISFIFLDQSGADDKE